MNNLRMLTFLVMGAIALSVVFATINGKDRSGVSFNGDGERMVRHTISGDRGEFVLKDDGRLIKAEWRGDFSVNDSGDGLKTLDDRLSIRFVQDGEKERAEFENDDGEIEARFYRDHDRLPAGGETDAAVKALMLKFLRASGLKAEARVAGILQRGGNEAVLAEMDHVDGGHALRSYAAALTKQADLSPAEISSLIAKLGLIDSDHDLSGALAAILEYETIDAETAPLMLTTASAIESDHDLRQLVEVIAERPLNDAAMTLTIGLLARMESDHDLRVSIISILENYDLNTSYTEQLLTVAAKGISSDYDLRLTLEAIAGRLDGDDALHAAYREAAENISSEHDRQRALEALTDATGD